MEEDRCSWNRLPDALGELVLSFLPVPALCRIRCVCKAWNANCCKPKFFDLCDLNNRSMEGYLFLTRYVNSWIDDSCRRTLCFLDLAEDRWYKIPAYNDDHDAATPLAPLVHTIPRHLALNDGLVGEWCVLEDDRKKRGEYQVILLDPIAKSRWELPALPFFHRRTNFSYRREVLPALVTAVDTASSSFKVFLLHSIYNAPLLTSDTRFIVYESSTGVWRGLPSPPEPLGKDRYRGRSNDLGDSAVFFQGKFYTISFHSATETILVLSYSLEENEWSEVLAFGHKTGPGYPQLHVFNNRLFMGMWYENPYVVPSRSRKYYRRMYKVEEILVNENSTRLWVQIPSPGMLPRGLYCPRLLQFALTSDSVVMVNGDFGEAIAFNVKSQTFHELPRHPFPHFTYIEGQFECNMEPDPLYQAKLMTLSMRNILSRSDQNASRLQTEIL